PHDMTLIVLHRLISILDTHPTLLTLFSVHQIYQYHDSDDQAQKFLQKYFNIIVELAVTSISSNDSQREIPWTIPLEWVDLKTAIIRLRPSFEAKIHAAENRDKAHQLRFEKEIQTAPAYKETTIWRELEAHYERASKGDHRARFKLYHMALDNHLDIPVRAAATYFFGRLEVQTGVIDKLAILVQHSNDLWNDYYSPIRFEAGKTLFEIGAPEAWEALIDAFFANPSNTLENFLWDWIQNLTDSLSGVVNTYEGGEQSIEMKWFRTLVKES
ncbi:MAG: hypothetical protein KF716_20830, partial [Anaerolineae bacterium]|nr:hypothetical protein [Anaerolineae bacterium]